MAGSAQAAYGFRSHYEVCSRSGEFPFISSLSVRENVFFAERRDDVIRVITQGGDHVTTSVGTGRPGEFFRDPIVGTSPTGAVYVINNRAFDPRLFKFSGRGLEREIVYPYGYGFGIANSVFGTRPGGRGSAAGEVYVGTRDGVLVFEADGTFVESSVHPLGILGSIVGVTGIAGAVLVATTANFEGSDPSWIQVFSASQRPLNYVGRFPVVENVKGVAGAPDNTWWVLAGEPPQFAGLAHYVLGQEAPDQEIPIDGQLFALSVAPDGAVWVARDDGLLRFGPNGRAAPPSQYLRGKCGPPQVRTSVPESQQVIRSRKLVVVASCNEQCTLRASGRLLVPGRGSPTFKLRSAKRQVAAGRRARLRLRLSRKAAATLRRAKNRGRRSSVQVTVSAADGGQTKSLRQFGLKIGR